MENKAESKKLMTQREVAKMLTVCAETVCRWTRKGVIPHIRVGNRYLRYEKDAVIKFMSSHRVGYNNIKK